MGKTADAAKEEEDSIDRRSLGALFVYKRLLETGSEEIEVTVFESSGKVGCGMPYSEQGACYEHVTKYSDKETLPSLE